MLPRPSVLEAAQALLGAHDRITQHAGDKRFADSLEGCASGRSKLASRRGGHGGGGGGGLGGRGR